MKSFENITGNQFELTPEIMEMGIRGSRESRRKRIILPIHRTQGAIVQRMLNFLQPGTYIRPHMHPLDHATESLVLIKGAIRFYRFTENGKVESISELKGKTFRSVIDIEPGVWHSFVVLEKDTVIFECKQGPYNVKTDKVFAKWAPEEGSDEVEEWLKHYEQS